ncbi:hypothetical protein ASE27_00395 [Oerskovia sp. Root918]|uniref:hypothetical protein n=1 Tax=unclassified Oerskovia TaxID=2619021 RepID=UPI0006FA5327|nr:MULTISPECIES: hypothetical protein [unclassified Oerskovia]KRC42925.1 hypothetical protein ASE15_02800 [Oerskovia sp. Root22]KRD46942.1 hypothetical protein ASE27_00395 [Oerskovia sp. Root918]
MHLLALDALTVAAESSSGEEGALRLVVVGLLLLAGPLFYWLTWRRYRNAGERHDHRRDTRSEVRAVRGSDVHVRRLVGRTNSRMSGANHRS